MIITCPDCETQFLVNPADIAPDGRDVKCSRCGYQWYVAPVLDADEASVGIPPMEPVVDHAEASVPELEDEEEIPATAPATQSSDDTPTMTSNQLPVPVEQVGAGWRTGISLLLVCGIVITGIFLVLEKQKVMAVWPASEQIYAQLGLVAPIADPVITPIVELRDVRVQPLSQDDHGALVTGQLVGPQDLIAGAAVVVIVEDANGVEWSRITLGSDDFVVDQGVYRFSKLLTDLPEQAHGVIVTLD